MFLLSHAAGLGKNWARYTLLILIMLGAVKLFYFFPALRFVPGILKLYYIIDTVLSSAALILLFTGAAHLWFKKEKIATDLIDDL